MAREIKTNINSTKGKMRKIKTVFSTWSQSVDVNCYTKMLNYGPNYKVQFVWLLILIGSTAATFYFIGKSLIDFLVIIG